MSCQHTSHVQTTNGHPGVLRLDSMNPAATACLDRHSWFTLPHLMATLLAGANVLPTQMQLAVPSTALATSMSWSFSEVSAL